MKTPESRGVGLGPPTGLLRLQLFVSGDSPRSSRAETNLRRLAEAVLENRYELEIVDVLVDPDRAEHARILTTPTVIRLGPPPRRRVTGDLSGERELRAALLPDFDLTPPAA